MGNSGRIKVGIAGLGRSGWGIHALALEELSDLYEVSAVSEKDPMRLEEARGKFGCRTYPEYRELIGDEEVELVVVATPSMLHPVNSIEALKAGKDVVCEKPMAANLKAADEMIRTASETGKTLTIFQNRRYAEDFVKVMEIVSSGKLGRIVEVKMKQHGFGRRWDWQTLKKYGGGELKNTCPHSLDQALQFFKGVEPEVYCHLERTMTLGDAEDHVKVILKAEGYPLLDIEVTKACAYPEENWLVMGTQGALAGTASKLRWKYFNPEDLPPRELDEKPTEDRSYNKDEIPWQPEEVWESGGGRASAKKNFYIDLHKALRENAPVVIKPEDVRKQIAVIEECERISPV